MAIPSGLQVQSGDRVVLDLQSLEIEIPAEGCYDDLMTWIWETQQDKICRSLSLQVVRVEKEPKAEAAAPSTSNSHTQSEDPQRTLDAITHVQKRLLDNERPRLVYGYLLEALLDFTGSAFGFIAEIKVNENNQQQFVNARACTNLSWNDEVNRSYEDAIETGIEAHNLESLFGSVLTTGEPVISNDPANDPRSCGGVPEGHVPLEAYLGIPMFKNGKVVGLLSLANKKGGYHQADIDALQPFTMTISLLLQVYLQMEQHEQLINTLEERVRERTHKLTEANSRLEQANRRVVAASEAQLHHFACVSHEIRTPLVCHEAPIILPTNPCPSNHVSSFAYRIVLSVFRVYFKKRLRMLCKKNHCA